jgi:hypothetical protein
MPNQSYAMKKDIKKVNQFINKAIKIVESDGTEEDRIGFMARATVLATLPHSKVEGNYFERQNGLYTLKMIADPKYGLPYGTIPRLLLAWITTEAVKKRSPILYLGENQREFLDHLALESQGGERGDITRLKNQMKRLFSCKISCTRHDKKFFILEIDQFLIASLFKIRWKSISPDENSTERQLRTKITLSHEFYEELITKPVPIDWRALKLFKRSPLQMDIYVWLTYRMSYLKKAVLISWENMKAQFGGQYADDGQGLRDFKKRFLEALKIVLIVYTQANVKKDNDGLILFPSQSHIKKTQC